MALIMRSLISFFSMRQTLRPIIGIWKPLLSVIAISSGPPNWSIVICYASRLCPNEALCTRRDAWLYRLYIEKVSMVATSVKKIVRRVNKKLIFSMFTWHCYYKWWKSLSPTLEMIEDMSLGCFLKKKKKEFGLNIELGFWYMWTGSTCSNNNILLF